LYPIKILNQKKTSKEFRGKPGRIIEQAARGMEVILTMRGKKMARLVPYKNSQPKEDLEDEIFGMWKGRDDLESVDDYVRSCRKGRVF
jgi:prevent-host-death family protein